MIGLGMLTDIYYVFIAILPAILIPMWRDAKKKYTAPRMKYIQFTEAGRVAAKTKAILVGLLLAAILTFTAGVFVAMIWSPSNSLLPWLPSAVIGNLVRFSFAEHLPLLAILRYLSLLVGSTILLPALIVWRVRSLDR